MEMTVLIRKTLLGFQQVNQASLWGVQAWGDFNISDKQTSLSSELSINPFRGIW